MFEGALAGKGAYREDIATWAANGLDSTQIYSALVLKVVRETADKLAPVYRETRGTDGFVTVPLAADLSYDVESLVEEAGLFWNELERENVIILVPATEEGITALQQLISSGVNTGVHSLLSVRRYREVFDAYLNGLEQQLARHEDVKNVTSVAEFALGRIEHLYESLPDSGELPDGRPGDGLAVSTARVAYTNYLNSVFGERFQALAQAGVRAQRLAWSATAGGDSLTGSFPDKVIGPATVCEMPCDAIRDLGRRSLSGLGVSFGLAQAKAMMDLYEQRCPDLEQRCAVEVERLINKQVLSTDRAIASINSEFAN